MPINNHVTSSSPVDNHRFSVAPMMDWTDRHYRYFARLLSRHTLLYSEMVTTGALLFGDVERHLVFNAEEQPLVLQLGGSNPEDLAKCAKLAEDWGYTEVNLNVGCPSDRVQNNMIGACLMGHANLVGECLAAMQAATSLPVTIKHRIGIDDLEGYDFLKGFVASVAESGCSNFIVHARKAILQGLSPKENRDIPPLNYDFVYQLKQDFPEFTIEINGGIKTLAEIKTHLQQVDGVMVGREAYQNPWLLADLDTELFGADANPFTSRHEAVRALFPYVEQQISQGQKLSYITRHILGIFQGQPGGKKFRRHLSTHAHLPGAGTEILDDALALVPEID